MAVKSLLVAELDSARRDDWIDATSCEKKEEKKGAKKDGHCVVWRCVEKQGCLGVAAESPPKASHQRP